jgi:prefoldin subunit 5
LQELNHLTASFGQLNAALAKFKACEENVKDLQKSGPGKLLLRVCHHPSPPSSFLLSERMEIQESLEEEWSLIQIVEREILVPLTQSLYVTGKLKKTDTVIVDVGTGYYIEKVCPPSSGELMLIFPVDNTRSKAILRFQDHVRPVEYQHPPGSDREKEG